MESKESSVEEATNDDVTSLSSSPPSSTISTPSDSSSPHGSSRNEDVASPVSRHHHKLPEGWRCLYDRRSKEYCFFRDDTKQTVKTGDVCTERKHSASAQTSRRPSDQYQCQYGYHFPSSPTPSMISSLAEQVALQTATKANQQKSRLTTSGMGPGEIEMIQKLCRMFPTAPEALVINMSKAFHQRENLIIASLICQGFRRAGDKHLPQAGAIDPTALIMTRPASKKLLEKLIGYFPDRSESYIKELMVKHNEVEHEIISAIVESSSVNYAASISANDRHPAVALHDEDKDGAMMKLRYLKFLYPDCDELDIFHMLHSNNMNAQSVIEKIEARGFKKSDIEAIMKKRKALNQQMKAQQAARAAAATAKEKALLKPLDLDKKPPKPNVTKERMQAMKDTLKKEFPTVYDQLIDIAIEAANYSEVGARRCLNDMSPQDDEKYRSRFVIDFGDQPDEIVYPSRSTQTGVNYKNVVSGSPVRMARKQVEDEWTLALTKCSVGTWTGDDIFMVSNRKSFAIGHDVKNFAGSILTKELIKRPKNNLAKGKMVTHVQGRNSSRCLPKKLMSAQDVLSSEKSIAVGSDPSRRKGPDYKILKKVHPFFL